MSQDSSLLEQQNNQPEQDKIQQTNQQIYPQQNDQFQGSTSQITTQQINYEENNLQNLQHQQPQKNYNLLQQIQPQQLQQLQCTENLQQDYNQQIGAQHNGDLTLGQPMAQFQLNLTPQKKSQIVPIQICKDIPQLIYKGIPLPTQINKPQILYKQDEIRYQQLSMPIIKQATINQYNSNAPGNLSAITDNTLRSANGCRQPTTIICPNCYVKGQTIIQHEISDAKCIYAIILCFIPFLFKYCDNIRHYCRACNQRVGIKYYKMCE